jgi:hypothetical protein
MVQGAPLLGPLSLVAALLLHQRFPVYFLCFVFSFDLSKIDLVPAFDVGLFEWRIAVVHRQGCGPRDWRIAVVLA